MRIAGGIVLLVIGLWSMVGGGCSVIGGQAAGAIGKGADGLSAELAKAAGTSSSALDREAAAAAASLRSAGKGYTVSGIIIIAGGLLSMIAGILALVNKGKGFCLLAPAVGVIGEITAFVMLGFGVVGALKIAIYVFGLIGMLKVGAPRGERPRGAIPAAA